MKKVLIMPFLVLFVSYASEKPEPHDHTSKMHENHSVVHEKSDERISVVFPPAIKSEELAQMRDHLDTLRGILQALANEDSDKAADLAENRLGLSSMNHGQMVRAAQYMPTPMRKLGFALHRNASRFAKIVVEENTTATYHSLATLLSQCVSCHKSYRIK